MKTPSFSPLIGAILFVGLILFLPEKWLSVLVTEKKVEEAAVNLNTNMFEGMLIQDKMLQSSTYLPIYGSSELSRLDSFHPSNYFAANPQGYIPFLVGKGGTASMFHFLNFAVNQEALKDKKIVFILSPQWFTEIGEDEAHFVSSYSVLKAYQFALHPTVSPAVFKTGANRLMSYDVVKKDTLLMTLLQTRVANETDTWQYKVAEKAGQSYLHILKRRDLLFAMITPKQRETRPNYELTANKNFEELEQNAEQVGKMYITNNPYYIKDTYYNRMYKEKINKLKGYKRHESFAVSPQYDDFQMILDVLNEAGAKALFISIPVNGYWYDYAEMKQSERTVYYEKINKQVQAAGFDVLDLSGYEYEPYFMTDSMHVGYKGWVHVAKGIEEFMKKEQ